MEYLGYPDSDQEPAQTHVKTLKKIILDKPATASLRLGGVRALVQTHGLAHLVAQEFIRLRSSGESISQARSSIADVS